jgi:light-regulated signal transduction histidine kinase (bacteriophytochrome)
LVKQKRQAEIGELLGNISHQWRNGLSQISSLNLEMIFMYELGQNLNNDEDFYERLKETETSIKFMVETINTFLAFYKIDTDYSTFEIKENIKQVLKLIDVEIKNSRISINIINNFCLNITANKNEWMHIWMNLITNSIKSAKFHHTNNPQITITINENEIIFIDNCKGFENELLENILNNELKGLGIKMSFDILKKSNWMMFIENSQNGAKFNIFNSKIKNDI